MRIISLESAGRPGPSRPSYIPKLNLRSSRPQSREPLSPTTRGIGPLEVLTVVEAAQEGGWRAPTHALHAAREKGDAGATHY